MPAVYRSAPFFSSYAPAKAFPTAQEALRHARRVRRRLSYRLRRLRVRERPPATGSGRSRRPTPPT